MDTEATELSHLSQEALYERANQVSARIHEIAVQLRQQSHETWGHLPDELKALSTELVALDKEDADRLQRLPL